MSALLLASQGKISLDDPVRKNPRPLDRFRFQATKIPEKVIYEFEKGPGGGFSARARILRVPTRRSTTPRGELRLKFVRDAAGRVAGFDLGAGRVGNLRFERSSDSRPASIRGVGLR